MIRHILLHFLTLIVFISQPACSAGSDLPSHYSAEAIEARVIDAKTKKPLEGVVVTANWQLLGGIEGNYPVGQMKVMEAVTDKDGRFYFPAWGPEPRKKGYLRDRDPQLILFKPGYLHRTLQNSLNSKINLNPVRRSDWNAKTIELKQFKGALEEYAKHLGSMSISLESLLREGCGWKNIPRMILSMDEQSEVFRKRGLYELPSIESLDVRYSNQRTKCGSVKEFFQSYRP